MSTRFAPALTALLLLTSSSFAAVPKERSVVTERTVEIAGRLEDDTQYLIRVPAEWNGTVVADLDYRTRADEEFYRILLSRGFALAGTSRREDRLVNLSQRRDVERVQEVLRIFATRVGRAKYRIVYGRSAGGGVALATAEAFPGTTEGAVALCATTPVLSANHRFDFLFLLKTLLAPNDPTVPVHPIPQDLDGTVARWQQMVTDATRTADGRARIALAFTMAQFPAFGHTGVEPGTPPPQDPDDPDQVLGAMLASVVPLLDGTLRNLRQLNTNPAPIVWNEGADYRQYFENADASARRRVADLYRAADLRLEDDLHRIESSARVRKDPAGLAVWLNDPLQTPRGRLAIPLFRMHTTGDQSIAQEQVDVHTSQVEQSGTRALLRTATVHRGGHCTFTPAEELAALTVIVRRLETGAFTDTSAEQLNALAARLHGTSNFVERRLPRFNGAWRMRSAHVPADPEK